MRADTPAHHLVFSTVRIEADGPNGLSVGTGFGFNIVLKDAIAPFIVTNRHVVEGATEGALFFTRARTNRPEDGPEIGFRIDISLSNFQNAWHFHPNSEIDIAVMPGGFISEKLIAEGHRPYFRPLDQRFIPTPEKLATCDAFEEIVFIGYPNGMYDERNLLPLVRRGTTATPPEIDYNGKPQALIDASVFPGSSGSPVFVWDPHGLPPSQPGSRAHGRPLFLLGVLTAVYQQEQHGRFEQIPIPTGLVPVVPQPLNIGIVTETSAVIETINDAMRTHTLQPPTRG